MRSKICGITSVQDAFLATDSGADAIGLVFYEPSPRYVKLEVASEIASSVGPFVNVVGLFVNAPVKMIQNATERVKIDLLQFHGDEPASFCEQFNKPYIKAIRMKPGLDVESAIAEHPNAAGILLDAYRSGVPGGTGESFDWARVPKQSSQHIILAGGLSPSNVARAISQTEPYAVDVSGGVEAAPGIKDKAKILAFIENIKNVNT